MLTRSMPRDTKWKLAIIAGFSECLIYAEAKYCAFEIHGEPMYYNCPKTEYCCNFGCCVSPGFQIYHLWYYWLLVIIMFLVCSGGGWWYRYWLQGRYRAATSAIPNRNSGSRGPNALRVSRCQAQQARISYNTARNTVLLHRMWKGPQRSIPSPAYNGAAASSTHYQNTNVVLNDANCPYYQLYGPPPSYETVIAQTRGKISSPASPELMRPNQRPGEVRNNILPQCYAHPYSPGRHNGRMELNHCQNSDINWPNSRLAELYNTNDNARRVLSMQLDFLHRSVGGPIALDKSDSSDAETVLEQHLPESCPLTRINCTGGSQEHPLEINADKRFISKVHETVNEDSQSSQPELATGSRINVSPGRPQKVHGGSLRITRNNAKSDACHHVHSTTRNERELWTQDERENSSGSVQIHQEDDSVTAQPATSAEASILASGISELNPSNNVILAPRTCVVAKDVSTSDANQPNRQRPPPQFDERGSTNSNLESKRKLDRSKSLD